jgi:hypothetical protein
MADNSLRWYVKDIVKILKARQNNEFDGNIAVSGDRGNGKSTLISQIFYKLKIKFNPWKHQVYNREDVIKLLSTQKYGPCFDDEAINSGYKREFQNKGQQELIKILTAYRDNYNIFASAIPNFFSLDKDLRDLYFLHLHIIERGLAVVHMPIQGRLYSPDKWDSGNNAKVEAKFVKRFIKDPNYKPKYNKLSTFRGYLYFKDLTKKQKALYKKVKFQKRKESFEKNEKEEQKEELSFYDSVYEQLINYKINEETIKLLAKTSGKNPEAIKLALRTRLRNNNQGRLRDFLAKSVSGVVVKSIPLKI